MIIVDILFDRRFIALARHRRHNRADHPAGADIDTGGSAAGHRPLDGGGDILRVFYQFSITPKTFEQGMERNIPKVRGHVATAGKEPLLLLRS